MKVINSPYKEDKRLTCDYPEDYKLLREVYKKFPNNELPRIHEVINLFVDQPDLWEINKGRPQLLHSDKAVAKFNKNFNSKKTSGLNFAKRVGRELTPGLTTIEVKI
jgi:spore coat polysaccharide biosynthesis protein SpsF